MEMVRKKNTFEVVIPIYNEEKILKKNLLQLNNFFKKIHKNFNFVIVDNGSTDNTKKIIIDLKAKIPINYIYLSKPDYGNALKHGILSSSSKWVFTIDIEQFDYKFLKWAWLNKERFDIFIGSKRADPNLNFQTKFRKFLSASLNYLLQLFFDFPGNDTHGPKLIKTDIIKKLIKGCKITRGQFDTEYIIKSINSGLKIVEIPIIYKEFRKQKNIMLNKIIWNIFALIRLNKEMKKFNVKSKNNEYYKFPRSIVNNV